jgi:hypothetical protein
VGDDLKADVANLTSRVQDLENVGTPAFAAQFKKQLKEVSNVPEFKSAVQAEISSWKAGQDVEHYGGHENILAKTETVGGKAEATGGKAEATFAQLGVYGYQAEFGLFKHEFSLTKLWEDRAQEKRDRKIDEQLAELKRIDGTQRASIKTVRERIDAAFKTAKDAARQGDRELKEQIAAFRKGLGAAERTANKAEQRGTKAQALAKESGSVSRAARTKANGAERKAQNALTQVSEVRKQARTRTNEVERKSRDALRQVDTLRNKVEKGMQQVRALESGAKSAGQAVKGLRNDLNALERDLRR